MPDLQPLTLHQGNDETIALSISRSDPTEDLTTVVELQLFLLPNNCAGDSDATLTLSSAAAAEITITSHTAAQIVATAHIPRSVLAEPYRRWWRLDGVSSTGQRRTAMYGPVDVVNV